MPPKSKGRFVLDWAVGVATSAHTDRCPLRPLAESLRFHAFHPAVSLPLRSQPTLACAIVRTQVFVVGVPRCNEPADLFDETVRAVHASVVSPAHTVVVDNGDERFTGSENSVVVRPSANVGRAGAWNIVLRLAFETLNLGSVILLDADCAVAPDTFARMIASPAPVVLALGFSCFRLDEAPWRTVGEFDEEFWPISWEDADYRRRLSLAGVAVEEWPIEEHARPSRGRVTYASGITHGAPWLHGYQGWSGRRLTRFREQVAANQARYTAKWGGPPGAETLTAPFRH